MVLHAPKITNEGSKTSEIVTCSLFVILYHLLFLIRCLVLFAIRYLVLHAQII